MQKKKKIVIIGATSAIAEYCARLWVHEPVALVLVGRHVKKLERIVHDLKVRSPESDINVIETDLLKTDVIQKIVYAIGSAGQADVVLIAHGMLLEQKKCQDDLHLCRESFKVNAISPVLWAEAFAQEMAKIKRGTIALISSVAGDRGRKSNYIYGAAKGLITRYAQGMQHRFAGTNLKVVLIKPGPTDTPMTTHLKAKGVKLASVEQVAKEIVKGIEAGKAVIYTPSKWRWIMLIIQHLPNFVFNKMDI